MTTTAGWTSCSRGGGNGNWERVVAGKRGNFGGGPLLKKKKIMVVAWAGGGLDKDGVLACRVRDTTVGSDWRSEVCASAQLWRNTGGGFSNVTASVAPGLPGVSGSSVAWGDYDNDGRLDFLLPGRGQL